MESNFFQNIDHLELLQLIQQNLKDLLLNPPTPQDQVIMRQLNKAEFKEILNTHYQNINPKELGRFLMIKIKISL